MCVCDCIIDYRLLYGGVVAQVIHNISKSDADIAKAVKVSLVRLISERLTPALSITVCMC